MILQIATFDTKKWLHKVIMTLFYVLYHFIRLSTFSLGKKKKKKHFFLERKKIFFLEENNFWSLYT